MANGMAIIGRRAAIAAFLALSCIGAAVGCAPVADVSDQEPDLAAPSDEPADLGVEDGGDLGDLADEAPPQGMEPEGGALAVRLDSYLDDNASRTGVPGVAVAVVDASGVRYLRTLGDCPDAEALFTIGSLSKSFTALAVMQLVEAGEVDLDAPASLYVPQYGAPPEVTVRSLLNQTSGFGYYDALADARKGASFGTFSYANANYDLLGCIVEAASGQEYAAYLRDHVLLPLGMDRSTADGEIAREKGMAPGHRGWFGVPVADGFAHASSDEAWGAAPSGYVAASVSDMARYLRMYLNGGRSDAGERVISPQGIESMFVDRVPDPEGDTYYGMGWTSFSWDDGETVLSHDGQVENYVASMCLLPERGLGVVVLGDASDHAGGDNLFFELANGVVAAAVGADPDPVDASWVRVAHARNDVLYACVLLASAAPLGLLRRWTRRMRATCVSQASPALRMRARRMLVARAVVLHVVAPLAVLALPILRGVPWRDVLTFAPDVAAVLGASAALLAAGGAAKLAVAVRMGRGRVRAAAPPAKESRSRSRRT